MILRYTKTFDPLTFGREKAVVTRAKEYIIENYYESISLDQLARISGMSPYYLLRTFRCAVGLPPHEFLLSIRIERAKELLTR
ncbi:AraC family transcriptional regulator [bacterium]|nr:AraC family transcriptional regulator [bacterium]